LNNDVGDRVAKHQTHRGSLICTQGFTQERIEPCHHVASTYVKCCFSKLKQLRRVATRFEKTARNYLAVVTIAAIILWMR
jgi:transposase